MTYDGSCIDEQRAGRRSCRRRRDAVARALHEAAREAGVAAGIARFVDAEALEQWRGARRASCARTCPRPGCSRRPTTELDAALGELCVGRDSFAELREAELSARARSWRELAPRPRALSTSDAPERVTLPGGARVRSSTRSGRRRSSPRALQDFFGLAAGPTLAAAACR